MEALIKAIEDLNQDFNQKMINQFRSYMDSILLWNEKVNLTAIKEKDEFIRKHYIDSITVCSLPQITEARKIADLGTGAGFPGIPLAILFPEKEFFLIDSLNKRLKIIEEIAGELEIKNITLVHGRAEDLGQNKLYREQFDVCVSRAVANLAVLSEYCLPLVRQGGYFIPYKTNNSMEEIDLSIKAIEAMGGKLLEVKKVALLEYELDHNLVIIKKEKKTPAKYPRKAGIPGKEPIK